MRVLNARAADSVQCQKVKFDSNVRWVLLMLCASAPAVQREGVLALQVRGERCRSERREEGREEAHPARMEGTHVRLREAADLQLGGLVLRIHCAFERPPVEVAPWTRCTGL